MEQKVDSEINIIYNALKSGVTEEILIYFSNKSFSEPNSKKNLLRLRIKIFCN